MSSKNLKVYRTEFVTEVGEMSFKVKFACQVKMIWKRSNQSAETTLVPVQNGVVKFNQTLKLKANMYFDPSNNKFVEKKCMYSFLIITDKGEKSAGKISFDFGEFLNKRQYEVNEDFPLQKCPLPDTKIRLKIYYNDSTEHGYDTMSQISAVDNNLDSSTMSMDISEILPSKKQESQVSEDGKSLTADNSKSQKKQEEAQLNYDLLNQSDLGDKMMQEEKYSSSICNEKMNENIQALNQISGKINDFVSKCSGNIKNEIQNLKLKNNSLEESLSVEKFQKEKLEQKCELHRKEVVALEKQFNQYKTQKESELAKEKQNNSDLSEKLEQSKKLCSQLENNLTQKGESQSSYLHQLKQNHSKSEQKLNGQIKQLQDKLLVERKEKNSLLQKIKQLEHNYSDLKKKYLEGKEKNENLQRKEEKREAQIEELRYKMENVYESLVASLGSMLK